MKQPLAKFRHAICRNIAQLNDLKSIMRVSTPRTVSFWLVLPACGDDDCVCILIKKVQERKGWLNTAAKTAESKIIRDYADRIITA